MSDEVWAVAEFCDHECNTEGASVVALYATEQTAKQHVDREGYGYYVTRIEVRTKLREW